MNRNNHIEMKLFSLKGFISRYFTEFMAYAQISKDVIMHENDQDGLQTRKHEKKNWLISTNLLIAFTIESLLVIKTGYFLRMMSYSKEQQGSLET